jgi:hypothetical protein
MKRVFRGPRVIAVCVLVLLAVSGVAASYPGGLVGVYEDFRDANALNDTIAEAKQRHRRLTADITRLHDRMEYKEELIAGLLRGEESLAEVSGRFADLHHNDECFRDTHQLRYGPRADDELAACVVLDYVATRTPSGSGTSVVRSRLRAEFEQRFGHPAPRLN